MPHTLSTPIAQQNVANDGNPHVVASQSFPAISPVNVLAGQQISAATIQTDANPSSYPSPGTIAVNAVDQAGNGYQVPITYTGHTGQGFTGCATDVTIPLATVLAAAQPQMTGQVSLDRTITGGLNSLTAATELDVAIDSSANGGQTWQNEAAVSTNGGIQTDRHGATFTTVQVKVGPINPAANQVRIVCTVPASSPSPVEVSGTATVVTL